MSLPPEPEDSKWAMPAPVPGWNPPPTPAERFATATDPVERNELLREEFEETPSTRLNVIRLIDELGFDRADSWQYDPADSTYGYHIGEVELLGQLRWFVWQNTGYEVDDVQICENRNDAQKTWRALCAQQCDIYFDNWEYDEDPDMEPWTFEQIDARLDHQWHFFARATGLPENVAREMLKAGVNAGVIGDITGGDPDHQQLDHYRRLAELHAAGIEPTIEDWYPGIGGREDSDRLIEEALYNMSATALRVSIVVKSITDSDNPAAMTNSSAIDGTDGHYLGEVELFGELRWCAWDRKRGKVDSFEIFADRSAAERAWLDRCLTFGDIYSRERPAHPYTAEHVDDLIDRRWPYYASATGLPEHASRAMMKARQNVFEVSKATGGSPTAEQLAAYQTMAALLT